MAGLEIQTAQNITLEYAPASIGDRILAFLLDYLIIVGYVLIMMGIVFGMLDMEESWILIALFIPIFFSYPSCLIICRDKFYVVLEVFVFY